MLIQEGFDNKQLPEAGFGINIIENLDSNFDSTLIATFASGLQPMISQWFKSVIMSDF